MITNNSFSLQKHSEHLINELKINFLKKIRI